MSGEVVKWVAEVGEVARHHARELVARRGLPPVQMLSFMSHRNALFGFIPWRQSVFFFFFFRHDWHVEKHASQE